MDRRGIVILSLVVLVFLLSFAVRLFRVSHSPPSLNWDEAALGYNAYSIYKTGKDEFGKVLPVSLRSFDDYKPALYSYLAIPPIASLGLNEIATRLPSVILGSILPISIFLIVIKLTGSKVAAFAGALTLAFEPWAIHFSRISFESNVATSLLYLGITLFIFSLKNFKYYYLSILLFVLSMYAYHSQRAIALPLLLILTYLFRDRLATTLKKHWIKLLAFVFVLLLPLAISSITEPVTSRLSSTNVLKLWPFAPHEFSLAIYNPIYSFLWQITGQYLAYFSPVTLFVNGSNEPGQYIPTIGLLHLVELPLWVSGFLFLKNYRNLSKLVIPLLILAPLPAIITWNWFSVVRTLPIYVAFAIVIGIGAAHIKRLFWPALAAIWLVSVSYLINTEILYSPSVTFGEYQPGFERAVPFLLSESGNYDRVIIDSPHIAPYIFLLFYGQYDPALYQLQTSHKEKNSGTESTPFGKIEFRQINWIEDRNLSNTLFMGPTPRLPDYEFEDNDSAHILADVYDIKGFISLRIVATK